MCETLSVKAGYVLAVCQVEQIVVIAMSFFTTVCTKKYNFLPLFNLDANNKYLKIGRAHV